ncbi:Predicted dithiol-disulfide isomerase, DsbA family [Pseudomonas pohangensis]|uniref:Predicted dithiol-disulfide isomerase, DsbA family n=1 Tax=Pseudomonas pohangensis TaxID=364197 RepID=A0A1H2HLM3_9PSED|nr:DsbA family oxidoreductase [Pseudomonas pohangensis]SDU32676.1 Predicted dithiol-disulfide isomerase, DsbA family [Pseudomonas pohangensis]
MSSTQRLKIDFVSDVSCPWCVIGLLALQQALQRLGDKVQADLHFQPFELNPQMPAEGQDIQQHLQEKYGSSPQQAAQVRENIRQRGAELGFRFNLQERSRIYNTFDAHRLLHWAGLQGRQLQLKQALFSAYFSEGGNPSSHELLTRLADEVGLDQARAAQILAGDAFAAEVRAAEQHYQENGIQAVPAIIINDRHLLQGGQPVEVFERALLQIAESS